MTIKKNEQKAWWRKAERLFFPAKCPCCRRTLPEKQEAPLQLCERCRRCLPVVGERGCLRCGKRVAETVACCQDCQKAEHKFTQAASLYVYSPEVSRMLLRMKNEGEKQVGEWLGEEMARSLEGRLRYWRPQLVVPVPLLRRTQRIRGYNQAQLLAEPIAERLGLSLETGLLLRTGRAKMQKALSYTERIGNLRGVFETAGTVGEKKRILLVDDVFTTGSTADVCAQALFAAGAEAVYVVTAATGGEPE